MSILEKHSEKQDGIDVLLKLKDQIGVIETCKIDNVSWYLIFDNNDEFWILENGVPVYRSEDYYADEAAQIWDLVCSFSKTNSFFDPVTKRGIVKEGPAYFDDSLPSMKDLEEITSHHHIKYVCTKCRKEQTCRCPEEKTIKHHVCKDCEN